MPVVQNRLSEPLTGAGTVQMLICFPGSADGFSRLSRIYRAVAPHDQEHRGLLDGTRAGRGSDMAFCFNDAFWTVVNSGINGPR